MPNFNSALWNGATGAGLSGQQICYDALRLLMVLRPGQAANTDTLADCLVWLNDLIGSWNTERLTVQAVVRDLIGIDSNSATVGPGKVEAVGYIRDTYEVPLNIRGLGWWADNGAAVSSAGEPCDAYVEYAPEQTDIYVSPAPTSGELSVYQWRLLEGFDSLETQIALPSGYAIALKYALASAVAPAFFALSKIPAPLLQQIEAKAVEYKSKIMAANTLILEARCDNAVLRRGRFNIYSGQ
jgi:hypothetical protein